MEHHLIVKHPFGDYSRGDRVTDSAEVARLLATVADHVVRVHAPLNDEAGVGSHPVEGSVAG